MPLPKNDRTIAEKENVSTEKMKRNGGDILVQEGAGQKLGMEKKECPGEVLVPK